jgi:hypothetical protein
MEHIPAVSPVTDSEPGAADPALHVAHRIDTSHGRIGHATLFAGPRGAWYLSLAEQRSGANGVRLRLLQSGDPGLAWRARADWPLDGAPAEAHAACMTRDGRVLRMLRPDSARPRGAHGGEPLFVSSDSGRTWHQGPPLLPARFALYPHRVRQLRDGTIVMAAAYGEAGGESRPGAEQRRIPALFFSYDEAKTWQGPVGVLAGRDECPMDFVEVTPGVLLVFTSGNGGAPARQYVYRARNESALGEQPRLVPGPVLGCDGGPVPRSVVRTTDGLLLGAGPGQGYLWSRDEGVTWRPLDAGTAGDRAEAPSLHQAPDGRILCAWTRQAPDDHGQDGWEAVVHSFRLTTRDGDATD